MKHISLVDWFGRYWVMESGIRAPEPAAIFDYAILNKCAYTRINKLN